MKTKSIIFALIILFVGSSFGHSQEEPPKDDYSWLNGRWEGTLFDGGQGIINLKVVDGNQVEGYERLALGGSVGHFAKNTQLAGTVYGNKVELRRGGGPTGMRYILTFVDGTLTGYIRSRKGEVETTFKKMHGTD
jgi:hypothetical protein